MNEIWNNEFEDEKSISLMDMLYYILRQWKKMAIVAVIAALAIMAVGVFKSYRSFLTMKNNPNAAPVELTEAEMQDLNDKLQAIKVYEESVTAYQTYLDESVICKLNPNGFYEGSLNYVVVLQSEDEAVSAKTICEAQILNEETYERVAKALGENVAASKLGEVIGLVVDKTVSEEESIMSPKVTVMSLKVTARYYTEEGCRKMLEILSQVVDEVTLSTIRADIEPLEKMSERVLFTSDASLVDIKQNILNAKNGASANLVNVQNSFTENQRKYQEWVTAGNTEIVEPQFEMNLNWKLVVVAAFAGAFCVAGIYGVMYLFNGRIHNKEELESYLRVPVFDMALDSSKGNTPEMIAVLLAGHLTALGLKNVYLTGSLDRQQAQALSSLKELVGEKGFFTEVGNSILTDATSLQRAADCGCMVFVEKCHESMEKDLKEEISKAMFCGIRVLGVILEN